MAVLLLGDSLVEQSIWLQDGFSFHAALQTRLIRRYDVVNRGLSGWNTANVVQFLSDIVSEPTPSSPKLEYLLVLLGANDAVLPMETTAQHVPIDEYKKNLSTIINHPHVQAHKPTILLVTPPPADEIKLTKLDMAEGHPSSVRKATVTASYAEKAREVARENPGVILIDLWQAIMDKAVSLTPGDYQPGGPLLGSPENGKQGGLDQLLPDGLHLGAEAYKIFFEAVRPHIGKEPASTPDERGDYVYPDWRVVNPSKVPLN